MQESKVNSANPWCGAPAASPGGQASGGLCRMAARAIAPKGVRADTEEDEDGDADYDYDDTDDDDDDVMVLVMVIVTMTMLKVIMMMRARFVIFSK